MRRKALLIGALLVGAVAASSNATASGPALSITSTPTIQRLETKIVSKHHQPGLLFGTAKFTITVANTGDVDLGSVSVVDPASPRCNRTIGALAVGASVSYACQAPNVGRNFTNRMTASADTQDGIRTLASATTAVKVKKPRSRHYHIHFLPALTG